MVSGRGMLIGILIMMLGVFVVVMFTSPDFLFSIGIDIKTYNLIQGQWRFWGPAAGLGIVIAGLVAMGKFE